MEEAKTIKLTTNMRVDLKNAELGYVFSKQLSDIDNGKIPTDSTTGQI